MMARMREKRGYFEARPTLSSSSAMLNTFKAKFST